MDADKPITPRQVASLLTKATKAHELSWRLSKKGMYDGRYSKDWFQCLREAECPDEWLVPLMLLLFAGYADIDSWIEDVESAPQTELTTAAS